MQLEYRNGIHPINCCHHSSCWHVHFLIGDDSTLNYESTPFSLLQDSYSPIVASTPLDAMSDEDSVTGEALRASLVAVRKESNHACHV